MHQGVLAARDEIARQRIAAALNALAERFGIVVDAAAINAVQGHDKLLRGMKQKEAVAACLEQIRAGLPAPEAEPGKRTRSKKDGLSD